MKAKKKDQWRSRKNDNLTMEEMLRLEELKESRKSKNEEKREFC
jgi:hypothetical protein